VTLISAHLEHGLAQSFLHGVLRSLSGMPVVWPNALSQLLRLQFAANGTDFLGA